VGKKSVLGIVFSLALMHACMVMLTLGFHVQLVGVGASIDVFTNGSLTLNEASVVALVNGSEAYSYDLRLESIALSHYAFRAAGSAGANEAADWIANQFESFGLEVEKEEFQFMTWDLLSKPALLIDDDGNPATSEDQNPIESFHCGHYSLPINVFTDLVVLPLPPARNRDEVGVRPIGTLWDAKDATGKVVLVGREIRLDNDWHEIFSNKLKAQPPAAVIYTWWYDWMAFVPDFFSSAGGIPFTDFGHYFWDLGVAVGFVNYDDGLFIRSRESSVDVSASVVIDSVMDVGAHYNVVGRITGYEEPEKLVIISGHYDTVMTAGFCDNGAGTSGVIELARVFIEAIERGFYYPKYTIVFVAFADEEIWLVGSVNYVMQHEAELENIVAVINLDAIGSDDLYVTETNPSGDFDLDELVLVAAADLGISATLEEPGGSDQEVFRDPAAWNGVYYYYTWGLWAGIDDATAVESSTMLISYPLVYRDMWDIGMPGWIHTSYDNSTSTETLDWVEVDDLEDHIKVAALTVMRVNPQVEYAIAVLTHEPKIAWANETITFNAAKSYSPTGNITSYEWDFGDNNVTTTTVPMINHAYTEGGSYEVNLTVTDEKGLVNTTTANIKVTFRSDLDRNFEVDIRDITIVAMAFGSNIGDENWNLIADLNDDEVIDIRDITMVALDFGKST